MWLAAVSFLQLHHYTYIYIHNYLPIRFIVSSHIWPTPQAHQYDPQQLFICTLFFFRSSLHTENYTHYYFSICVIYGYHRVTINWKQVFLSKKNKYTENWTWCKFSIWNRRWKKSDLLIRRKYFWHLWTKSEVLWYMLYREFSQIAALKGRRFHLVRWKCSFTHTKIRLNSFDEGTLDSNLLH